MMLSRFAWSAALALGLALPLAAQTSGSGQAQPPSDQPAPAASQAPDNNTAGSPTPEAVSGHAASEGDQQEGSNQPENAKKPPTGIKKVLRRAAPTCAHLGGAADHCWSESGREKEAEEKRAQEAAQQQPPVPPSQSAPRSDGRDCADCSSSRDTRIDLSPPPGDAASHEGADLPGEVQELHPWDPHRADKDVEVGDFYFKQKNYKAAVARYRDALEWMPSHALATYKLAEALEKSGEAGEARQHYEQYLKLLPKGEYAEPARKALERLPSTAQSRTTTPPRQKPQ